MNLKTIQVAILNHTALSIKKFSRNAQAIQYYQEGESGQLIDDLYQHWFGINEACIIAHHLTSLNAEEDHVNYVVAINPLRVPVSYDIEKLNGKSLRYVFIFFEMDEMETRHYVYHYLKSLLLTNKTQPIEVEVEYHNVIFY